MLYRCKKCRKELTESKVANVRTFNCSECKKDFLPHEVIHEPVTPEEIKTDNINKYITKIKEEQAVDLAEEHLEGYDEEFEGDKKEQVGDLMCEILDGSPKGDDDLDFDMGYVEGYGQAMRDILHYSMHIHTMNNPRKLTYDDTRDLAINILDTLLNKDFVEPNEHCDDETEFEVQDIIHGVINDSLDIKEN